MSTSSTPMTVVNEKPKTAVAAKPTLTVTEETPKIVLIGEQNDQKRFEPTTKHPLVCFLTIEDALEPRLYPSVIESIYVLGSVQGNKRQKIVGYGQGLGVSVKGHTDVQAFKNAVEQHQETLLNKTTAANPTGHQKDAKDNGGSNPAGDSNAGQGGGNGGGGTDPEQGRKAEKIEASTLAALVEKYADTAAEDLNAEYARLQEMAKAAGLPSALSTIKNYFSKLRTQRNSGKGKKSSAGNPKNQNLVARANQLLSALKSVAEQVIELVKDAETLVQDVAEVEKNNVRLSGIEKKFTTFKERLKKMKTD